LTALSNCAHELAILSAAGATADVEQAKAQNWVARCDVVLAMAMTLKPGLSGSCQGIWDKRATLPGFAELDANLKAVDTAMGQLDPLLQNSIASAFQAFRGTGVLSPGQPAMTSPQSIGNSTENTTTAKKSQSGRAQGEPCGRTSIDMSLGPASKGVADPTPYSDSDEGREGADYRNALSKWVSEHAYYPEQARRDGDEGDVAVCVIAEPNGMVKDVHLIGKSGSTWLDLALLSVFRDQRIPLPLYGTNELINFKFTMHYVLIRR
jgi:TonB family protein